MTPVVPDFPTPSSKKREVDCRPQNTCSSALPHVNCEPDLICERPLAMHGFEETGAKIADEPYDGRPWYQLLTRYHWFVLVVAALGWLFDCLDQQLFNLARNPAVTELLGSGAPKTKIDAF